MKKHRTGNTKALGYFNLLRGCGIFSVLLFHTCLLYFERNLETDNKLTINGAGLMAMFFIVSGYGFFKRKPLRCFKMQFKLLMVPYILMCSLVLIERAIYDLIRGIPFEQNGGSLVLTYLFGLCVTPERKVAGFPVSFVGLFWFLLALFTGWNIYNLISQIKNQKIAVCCVILSVFLGWLLPKFTDLWPYCIPQGLLAVGFLYLGEYIRKTKLLERSFPPVVYAIVLLWIGISEVYGGGDMGTNYWKLGVFAVISAALIGMLLVHLYFKLYPYIPNNKVAELVETVGGESFMFFCIHGLERVIIPWYVIQRYISNPVLGTGLYFFLRCVVVFSIYKVIKKIQQFIKPGRMRKKTKITLD